MFILFTGCIADAAALTIQEVSETVADISKANADTGSGDTIVNKDGRIFIVFDNPGASQAIATITAQSTERVVSGYGPMTKADLVVTMEAGEEKIVGPFSSTAWSDSSGLINIAYSGAGAADIDVAALKLIQY